MLWSDDTLFSWKYTLTIYPSYTIAYFYMIINVIPSCILSGCHSFILNTNNSCRGICTNVIPFHLELNTVYCKINCYSQECTWEIKWMTYMLFLFALYIVITLYLAVIVNLRMWNKNIYNHKQMTGSWIANRTILQQFAKW